MRTRKHQKEVDKAVANLMTYSTRDVWAERQKQAFEEALLGVATPLDISSEALIETLDADGYSSMVFGCVFELFVTSHWDHEDYSFIDDHLKRRGWRETPYARRYLIALNESDLKLWEAVDVTAGEFIDVRPAGSTEKPVRVYEQSASQTLTRWHCIAARVIELDGKHMFTGGVLPFSPEQVADIGPLKDVFYKETIDTLRMIREEDKECDWTEEQMATMADETVEEQLPDILLTLWMTNVYLAIAHPRPRPTLVNHNGDLIQPYKVAFRVEASTRDAVQQRLDAAPTLNFDQANEQWVWLSQPADRAADSDTTVLGWISFLKNGLELTVNSAERAEKGKALLKDLLGDLIGAPLTTTEDLDAMIAGHVQEQQSIDAPEMLTALLDQHYRKTLDEPIPMLGNKSPRQCAEQPAHRAELIQWLKELESHTQLQPHMAHYSFDWMWQELGVQHTD